MSLSDLLSLGRNSRRNDKRNLRFSYTIEISEGEDSDVDENSDDGQFDNDDEVQTSDDSRGAGKRKSHSNGEEDRPLNMCGSVDNQADGDFWKIGEKIRVRFLEGSPEIHRQVKEHVKTWEKYANVKFHFVEKGPAQIRVSFKQGKGSYSQVGTSALAVQEPQSTMNLDIGPKTTSDEIRRFTLHEFGHVLGFIHEHSSPLAQIPWDMSAVYKYYKKNFGWPSERVDANILKTEGVGIGDFDKDSIMMYPVDKKLTKGGYEVPMNTHLSKLDMEAATTLYPFDDNDDIKESKPATKRGKSGGTTSKRQVGAKSYDKPLTGDLTKAITRIRAICDDSDNRSTAFNDGSQGYKDSVRHYVDSSSEVAAIAVQPGSEADLAKIIKCIAKYRVPFAVKGGGHSMVPGFSSTTGIQISMTRFSKVSYNASTKTVDVGAGCLWDEVYNALTPLKRNVVGGAARQGVGVAGWLLGGGYSLKSNKYGLGIDNIEAFRVVLPDGTICEATKESRKYADLYQALRGGGNNFGIVTQFTLKTHPHGPAYGASFRIPGVNEKKAKRAIMDFVTNEERKEAALVAAFRHSRLPGQKKIEYVISVLCVFDAKKPTKKSEIPFQQFQKLMGDDWKASNNPASWKRQGQLFDIPSNPVSLIDSESGFHEMSADEVNGLASNLYDLDEPPPYEAEPSTSNVQFAAPSVRTTKVKGMDNLGELNVRGRFGCLMISKYTAGVVDAIAAEAKEVAKSLSEKNGRMVVIDVWPFLESIFDRSPPGAAWPHDPDQPFGPLLAYFQWYDEKDDEFWVDTMKSSLRKIRKVALAQGATIDSPPYYSNTSLESVPVKRIYRENLKKLSKLRTKYDPDDVMSLTGGFRIPLAE